MPALTPRLRRYCVVLSGNRDVAHDLAQSACLRAIEKAHQFEQGSNLGAWVFRIAQRIRLNELRAQSVRRGGGLVAVEDADISAQTPSAESNIFVAEVLSQVRALPEANAAR